MPDVRQDFCPMHIICLFDLIKGSVFVRRPLFICIIELDFKLDGCVRIGIRGGKRK